VAVQKRKELPRNPLCRKRCEDVLKLALPLLLVKIKREVKGSDVCPLLFSSPGNALKG